MHRNRTRIRFLTGACAGLGAAAFVRAPARAAQFQWRLGQGDSKGSARNVRMIQMANAVKAETNGRLEIAIFSDNQLGTQTGQLTQLREGSIQLYMTFGAGYAGIVPSAQIDSVGFAFTSQRQPCQVFDGPLGAYVRKEFEAKGIHVFEKVMEAGFRQVTASTHPIAGVDDFSGFKIRTPPARMFVDLFKTLGASPVPVDSTLLYTSLQTHLVDGQETPLEVIEIYRLYEVQKYLSITNHMWTGAWLVANMEAWNGLPSDIQAVVTRNCAKYCVLERTDVYRVNDSLADKLQRQGFTINKPDTAAMRARLGPYYARWKAEFGNTVWGLLEAGVGKLA